MAEPFGSISGRRSKIEDIMRQTDPTKVGGQPVAHPIFGMTPIPHPQWNPTGGWPTQGGTGQAWDMFRKLEQRPTGTLGPEQQDFMDYWKQYTPPAGLQLPDFLKGPAGRDISMSEPSSFNTGDTVKSAFMMPIRTTPGILEQFPRPQLAQGFSGDPDQMGWKPAQAEATPDWMA